MTFGGLWTITTIAASTLAAGTAAKAPAQRAEALQQSRAGGRATADSDFLARAIESGLKEVELGRLAARKANHPDVKAFASLMVEAHRQSNAELATLAAPPPRPPAEALAAPEALRASTGEAFDFAYMAEMVSMHEKSVALYEQQANGGKDAALKSFAARKLPIIRTHLVRAKAVRVKIGATADR